jgi:hypothetical protein
MKLRFFLTNFLKDNPILNFMKLRPVGAELFNADGQKVVTFHNSAHSPDKLHRAQLLVPYAISFVISLATNATLDQASGGMVLGSIPSRVSKFLSCQNRPDRLWSSTSHVT